MHQMGTAKFRTDPRISILAPYCSAHDLENVFVMDSSFFVSAGTANLTLTIMAQMVTVDDFIATEVCSIFWGRRRSF